MKRALLQKKKKKKQSGLTSGLMSFYEHTKVFKNQIKITEPLFNREA